MLPCLMGSVEFANTWLSTVCPQTLPSLLTWPATWTISSPLDEPDGYDLGFGRRSEPLGPDFQPKPRNLSFVVEIEHWPPPDCIDPLGLPLTCQHCVGPTDPAPKHVSSVQNFFGDGIYSCVRRGFVLPARSSHFTGRSRVPAPRTVTLLPPIRRLPDRLSSKLALTAAAIGMRGSSVVMLLAVSELASWQANREGRQMRGTKGLC